MSQRLDGPSHSRQCCRLEAQRTTVLFPRDEGGKVCITDLYLVASKFPASCKMGLLCVQSAAQMGPGLAGKAADMAALYEPDGADETAPRLPPVGATRQPQQLVPLRVFRADSRPL
jgi:hypothetical protein